MLWASGSVSGAPSGAQEEWQMSRMKTAMLLATLTALLLWAGQALGGESGLMTALVFAGLMNFVSYWWSDKIVLRMYRAQEVTAAEAPGLDRKSTRLNSSHLGI